MNIGIAGRTMNTPGGVKEYLEGFCYGLSHMDLPKDTRFFFFKTPKGVAPRFRDALSVVSAGSENRFLWDFLTLPRLARRHKIDVMLHVKNTIPPTFRRPSVVVVHDLLHILQPEVYKPLDSLYIRNMMRHSLPRAKQVIAISENTKKDLLEQLSAVSKDNVSVVYQDAMPRFDSRVTDGDRAAFRKRYSLPEQYVLFTGSLSPRKNLERLFEAFASIQGDVPHSLVVTGGKAWKDASVHATLERFQLGDAVQLLGFVPDDDMPLLYQSASAFVYPSLYEGFGIPIVEAFASGVPVMSSNTSSLPEVGGDAVAYFDPQNTHDIARVMKRVLMDPEKQERLVSRGNEQRRAFSWKNAASTIVSILQQSA